MEEVIFDGKEYVKASVLAKRFRYTADYLGQLCRGKKVDARLVGRAWYINLDSLNHHRDARYKTSTIKVVEKEGTEEVSISKKSSSNYLSRIEVEPILKKKTVSIFKNKKNGALSEFPVKYESDEYSLIPRVNRAAVSKDIHVYAAGAEKIRIHKEGSAVTSFRAEELPEVFLRGTLKVAGLEEATESLSEETADIQPEIKPELKIGGTKPGPIFVRPLKKRSALTAPRAAKELEVNPVSITKIKSKTAQAVFVQSPRTSTEVTIPVFEPKKLLRTSRPEQNATPLPQKAVFKPLKIDMRADSKTADLIQPQSSASFKPRLVVKKEEKRVAKAKGSSGWVFSLFIILCACILAIATLALTTEIMVTKSGYQLKFLLDWNQLHAAILFLKNL